MESVSNSKRLAFNRGVPSLRVVEESATDQAQPPTIRAAGWSPARAVAGLLQQEEPDTETREVSGEAGWQGWVEDFDSFFNLLNDNRLGLVEQTV